MAIFSVLRLLCAFFFVLEGLVAPLEVEALANYASVEKTQTVFTTETLRTAVGAWCKDKESAKEIYGDIEN